MKRFWTMLIFVLLLATAAQGAEQVEVPSLHYIIPAKAGGGFEHSSKTMSGSWSELLGNPIEFSFEPGMSGGIGFGKLMARPADGYTVLMTEISMHAMHINMGVVLDGWQNIGFIGNLITDPNVLLVNIDSPYKTLQDFIDAGKKATTPLKISTSQPESISTLAAKIFIKETGINAEVVAYRGGSESRAMLAAKKADASIGPYFSASPMKDKIKALASFTQKKVYAGLWDIPTVNQVTGKDLPEIMSPYAVMVKKATATQSPERYQQLVQTFKAATQSAKTRAIADKTGMTPFIDYWSPEQCEAYVKNFQVLWNKYKGLMR